MRWFSDDVDSSELKWHRDARDRSVRVIDGSGWKLQMDDGLPQDLTVDSTHFIPKNEWHRLHMGKGTLVLEIIES
jgi:hypothetical protein